MTIDDPVVLKVRAELDRRGWSYQRLADKSLVSESAVYRLFKGRYTHKTIRKIEHVLELELLKVLKGVDERAEDEFGGYMRSLYAHYEGRYFLIRPSFSTVDQLIGYPFEIRWSIEPAGLAYIDKSANYEQRGMIHVPDGTPFIHLITMDRGAVRVMTAFQMVPKEPCIRGLTLTLANPRGRQLVPAVAPFVIHKANDKVEQLEGQNGVLTIDKALQEYVSGLLRETQAETLFVALAN